MYLTQNQSDAGTWSAVGVTALKFYIDGQFIGSCAASEYTSSSPSCGASGQASKTVDMGTSSKKSVSYSIKDQDGAVWYSGSLNLDASNSCFTFQF